MYRIKNRISFDRSARARTHLIQFACDLRCLCARRRPGRVRLLRLPPIFIVPVVVGLGVSSWMAGGGTNRGMTE